MNNIIPFESLKTKNKLSRYLRFKLNDDVFGVEINEVIKVYSYHDSLITKILHLNDYFYGVVDVNGSVIPILNTKKYMKLKDYSDMNKNSNLILREKTLGKEKIKFAMLVDEVLDVVV